MFTGNSKCANKCSQSYNCKSSFHFYTDLTVRTGALALPYAGQDCLDLHEDTLATTIAVKSAMDKSFFISNITRDLILILSKNR
jgi:hypothetical protein